MKTLTSLLFIFLLAPFAYAQNVGTIGHGFGKNVETVVESLIDSGDLDIASGSATTAQFNAVAAATTTLEGDLSAHEASNAVALAEIGVATAANTAAAAAAQATADAALPSDGSGSMSGNLSLDAQVELEFHPNSLKPPSATEAQVFYDRDEGSVGYFNDLDRAVRLGYDALFKGRADEALSKGDAVYVTGSVAGNPTVAKADATSVVMAQVIGLAADNISINQTGDIIVFGSLEDIDTNDFNEGDILYLSSSTAGAWQNTPPPAPNYRKAIGVVTNKGISNGSIGVSPTSLAPLGFGDANEVLGMNAAGTFKEYKSISAGSGITVNHTAGDIEIVNSGVAGHGDGANCSAGNAPLGVDAAGAVQSCFDVQTATEQTAHEGDASAHHTATVDTFVTNKDSHDHLGGDGAQILHSSLGSVGANDHHTPTDISAVESQLTQVAVDTTTIQTNLGDHEALSGASAHGDSYVLNTGDSMTGDLFVVNSSSVGIGTSSPITRLHVSGGDARVDGEMLVWSDDIRVAGVGDGSNGRVDVNNTAGTTGVRLVYDSAPGYAGSLAGGVIYAPTNALTVNGNTSLDLRAEDAAGLIRLRTGSSGLQRLYISADGIVATDQADLGVRNTAPTGMFEVGDGTFTIAESGQVGLGTTAPSSILDISMDSGIDEKVLRVADAANGGGNARMSYNFSSGASASFLNFGNNLGFDPDIGLFADDLTRGGILVQKASRTGQNTFMRVRISSAAPANPVEVTELMRITLDGVSIGPNAGTPAYPLDVEGDADINGNLNVIQGITAGGEGFIVGESSFSNSGLYSDAQSIAISADNDGSSSPNASITLSVSGSQKASFNEYGLQVTGGLGLDVKSKAQLEAYTPQGFATEVFACNDCDNGVNVVISTGATLSGFDSFGIGGTAWH